MKTIESRIIITVVLFILMIISGIWLSRVGKPYNTAIFTLHKLISLAAIVFSAIVVFNLHKNNPLVGLDLTLIIAVGLFFIVSLVSGGLLSVDKFGQQVFLGFHKVMPFLIFIAEGYLFYRLLVKV